MNRTVLVVDDSAMMRKIILRLLQQAEINFHSVLEAADGIQALDLLRANPVALILCDINMPNMDGIELLRHIQQEELAASTPIVMVTTESSEAQVRLAIALGARGFIRKPFTADHIRETVRPLLTA